MSLYIENRPQSVLWPRKVLAITNEEAIHEKFRPKLIQASRQGIPPQKKKKKNHNKKPRGLDALHELKT